MYVDPLHSSATSQTPLAGRQGVPAGNKPAPDTPTCGHNDWRCKQT